MNEIRQWLPDLDKVVPVMVAHAEKVSLYTIALEGWKRGLTLTFHRIYKQGKLDISFSLKYKEREHFFDVSKGDKVSEEAEEICSDKWLTKECLLKAGVPAPKGKKFDSTAGDKEIIEYAKDLGFPLVLKPTDGSSGKGVFPNITNVKELQEALNIVRQRLRKLNVIIEQYLSGDEFRVYVVGNKVIAAVNRVPANITGDGKQTISELINAKNEERKKVPHLYNRPIKVDRDVIRNLGLSGYSLESTPEKGEQFFLKKISNVSAGGEPVDVTDRLSENIKDIAIRAVTTVPGLAQCGVDIIVNELQDTGVILELNTKAGIGSHLFPVEGRARNVPQAIIDFYFPEVKNISAEKTKLHFNFIDVITPLQTGATDEVQVTDIPKGNIYAKKFTLDGNVHHESYCDWLREEALNRNLSGFVKYTDDHMIEVVIAGTTQEEVEMYKDKVISGSLEDVHTEQVKEELWEHPVQTGFEIYHDKQEASVYELEAELDKKSKDLRQVKKEKRHLERQNKMIQQSKFWKLMFPLRVAESYFKKIK